MFSVNNKFRAIIIVLVITVLIILITFSDICKCGVERGMLICANVIIPSLFPFMVCILIILNMDITIKNKLISKIIFKLFGQSVDMFFVMILSMLGGYPIGCKLINELYIQDKINKKDANIMQMYCINAGPAFIISAVGSGVLSSKKIGNILFFSHISASIVIALITSKFLCKNCNISTVKKNNYKSFSEIFVKSTADATSSVISICAFIILFSVINSYLIIFLKDIPILNNVFYFTEITSGITFTKNVVFISFLLGFSGMSIWCQIFSILKNAKPDLKLFILGRILHGSFSSIITLIIINIFKIKINVFSNSLIKQNMISYNDITLSISLIIMIIVLLIYIYSKNYSRKIIDDMI